MNLLDLFVKVSVDDSGLDAGMDRARKTVSGASDVLSAKAVAIGNAVYDMGKRAATSFTKMSEFAMDVGTAFDTSMASVAAISGSTGDELEALTEKAKEMGAKTKFSASESADAFTYMAMAGWKTGDMLDGIEGIMNLAAASGENLASVSDIVTDALTAFGLSAKDSGHFADVLAAASNNANTNVSMLGGSFKYVGPVAGALGYSIEDVSVALGLMANSGIKAEQAGTSMRSMLTRLAKPTKDVESAFERLGINAVDAMTNADGTMKPLSETLGILREKMSGLSEAEQANVAAGIAGQEAMSGLLAIVNASDSDYQKLTVAINNADGTAQGMADTMNDNLPGAITILKSALEGLGIAVYENGSGRLKEFVERMTETVSKITEFVGAGGLDGLIEGFRNLLPWITGITSAIVTYKAAMAIAGIIDAVRKATEGMTVAQAALNAVMKANPFVLIASLIAMLVTALVTLYMTNEEFRNKVNAAWTAVKTVVSNAISGFEEGVNKFFDKVVEVGNEIIGFFKAVPGQMVEIGRNLLMGLWNGIKDKVEWLKGKVTGVVDTIKGWFTGKNGFDEHSPSKWSRGVFRYVMEGGAEGLDDGLPALMRGVSGVTGRVKSGLDFGTASVGFADSGIGISSAAIVNSMGKADDGGGSTTLNLMLPDGTKLATYTLPFLIRAAAAAGTPIANPQTA
nr:MAG TPA: minor tail protein [Caudoviricetes sp.]